MPDITKPHAAAQLAHLLSRGDTVHVVLRTQSRRLNTIVDFVLPPTERIGEYVAAVMSRPYLYSQRGVLLRKGQQAESFMEDLSVELFGEPRQLKWIWL